MRILKIISTNVCYLVLVVVIYNGSFTINPIIRCHIKLITKRILKMVVANIFNHNLQIKDLNIIPIDKKLNSFLYCIFYQLTTPVWDINSTDMSSITTLIDMDMDMEDIESTDGVSILSDDLLQSEDSNTVIAVDSDEEIYSDDDEHEDEYVIDNIFREECEFLDSEKVDGKHYIGLCRYFPTHKLMLYANAIRPAYRLPCKRASQIP